MGLSFEDSLKAAQNLNNKDTDYLTNEPVFVAANIVDVDDYSISTTYELYDGIVAYAGDDGNWTQHTGYKYYESYSDDNISFVDEDKKISLHKKQHNITQETNSQYMPFEMPRYYDGFDLTTTTISIHYETKDKYHGVSEPVNVSYNDEKIRFAWLVDDKTTHIAGNVKFVIRADGVTFDDKGNEYAYTWKLLSN